MIGYEKSTPAIAQGVSGFCNRASEVFFYQILKLEY